MIPHVMEEKLYSAEFTELTQMKKVAAPALASRICSLEKGAKIFLEAAAELRGTTRGSNLEILRIIDSFPVFDIRAWQVLHTCQMIILIRLISKAEMHVMQATLFIPL